MKTNLRNRGLGLVIALSLTPFALAQAGGGQDGPSQLARPRIRINTIQGKVGEWVTAGPAKYRVVMVDSGMRSYRQQFNQWGKKLHPGFPSDRLAAITLEVQNMTERPIEPPMFMAALTDSEGARTSDWIMDVRQQAFLEESVRGGRAMSRVPEAIGPQKVIKLALVFSVAPKSVPTQLEFSPRNFRDMPFGDPSRYRQGAGGQRAEPRAAAPSQGTQPAPMRVVIDLTEPAGRTQK